MVVNGSTSVELLKGRRHETLSLGMTTVGADAERASNFLFAVEEPDVDPVTIF